MKRFMMTIALVCVLSSSALAGEIPTSGVTSPPPSEPTETTSATSPGEMPTGGFAQQISDAGLSVLLSVLGLVVV
jgi:hypothetical protein